MQKNEIYTIEITDMNNLGNGIGRIDGKAVFVQGGVDGDILKIKIIKVSSDYAVARIEEIIRSSEHRITSDCPMSKRCGGCVYRSITYAHELELKRNYVKNAFKKAGLDINVHPVCHGDERGYRNKVQYPVGEGLKVGFYAGHSHEVVPCTQGCLLEDPAFAFVLDFTTDYLKSRGVSAYSEKTGKGLLRHIYLRRGKVSSEMMVCLVINGEKLTCANDYADAVTEKFPFVKTVVINSNREDTNVILGKGFRVIKGKGYIEDTLCSLKFRISAPSFWQVNHQMTERLYGKAAALAELKEGETLCDLFCGIGSIGLSVISRHPSSRLLGVEVIPEAVANARENAMINGIANAEFICADANSTAIEKAEVIILDPPRKGCAPSLINRISELSPRRVVYVSCNPDTLARDLAIFKKQGYTTSEAFPFDLFPRTGHVESLVCLTKQTN